MATQGSLQLCLWATVRLDSDSLAWVLIPSCQPGRDETCEWQVLGHSDNLCKSGQALLQRPPTSAECSCRQSGLWLCTNQCAVLPQAASRCLESPPEGMNSSNEHPNFIDGETAARTVVRGHQADETHGLFLKTQSQLSGFLLGSGG